MSLAQVLLAIIGVGILMVVHEFGHYLAARRFGMRVETFSIGFGPTIWKKKPEGSPTTYQIAIIPFLAYVKIAGMNPFEPVAADDKGSYANASLLGRIVTIAGGPLANYIFAVFLTFFGLLADGRLVADEVSMRVEPKHETAGAAGPALQAGMLNNDRILRINGQEIRNWDDLKRNVGSHVGENVDIELERDGKTLHLNPRVGADGESKGKILVAPITRVMDMKETAWMSFIIPPKFIYDNLRAIGRAISFQEKPKLGGPVRIVSEVSKAIALGLGPTLQFLGIISAGLVAINLLPIPALDGGRLVFLFYEAISRKRANEKVEAKIHAVALLMFLALFVIITINDIVTIRK
jgi:regulator of sigma E protease